MKRRIFRDTLRLCLQAALAIGMTGCADESCPVCSGGQDADGQKSGVFLSVMIRTVDAPASRSGNTPRPGENGDGQQAGTEAENRIRTLTLFFFTDESEKGINAEADTPLTTVSFDQNEIVEGSGAYACSVSKEVEELAVGNSYSVLAVANFSPQGTTTLGQLRDLQVEAPTTTSEDEQLFLMSSAGPKSDRLAIAASNSKTNPATVTINMERVTARVDYRVSYPDGMEAFEIPSRTPDAENGAKDKVQILGAALVNQYAGKSYLFKRVTQGTELTNPGIVYLGNETVSEGKASNYVLDPQTLTGKEAKDFTAYYPELTGSGWTEGKLTFKKPSTEITSTDESDKPFGLLDYTAENVNRSTDAEHLPECATGVVFKAKYIPYGDTKGRTCYYTYWIRHADDGDTDKASPMEYVTVRNNLYQLDVRSVSGPGTDKPEYEQNINIQVTVNRWVKAQNGKDIEW